MPSVYRYEHAGDDPGVEQGVVRQLFTLASRSKGRCVSREITNDSGPSPVLIYQVAKKLPIELRGISDDLDLFFERHQKSEQRHPGFNNGQRVAPTPQLWKHGFLYEITAVFFLPSIEQFHVEFVPILSD